MSGLRKEKGVITTLRDRINLCDKDNTKAGMEVVLDVENEMKKEKMRQEVVGRSQVVNDTKKAEPNTVDLAKQLRADMEEEPVL